MVQRSRDFNQIRPVFRRYCMYGANLDIYGDDAPEKRAFSRRSDERLTLGDELRRRAVPDLWAVMREMTGHRGEMGI